MYFLFQIDLFEENNALRWHSELGKNIIKQ